MPTKMSFKFRDCWELLKDVPKWRNYCGVDVGVSKSAASAEDKDNENSVYKSTDYQMESTGRPKGCKSAKTMVVGELERSKQANAKQQALEQTIKAQEEKNRLLAKFNETKLLKIRLADLDDDAREIVRLKRRKLIESYQG
ncbi:hypothetical protein BCR33DRAFT_745781 [Rhizoclosmatium globosum]|uniref:No apical meristem-associated C-terminal domain-containing protein n=1 Tax=Rhizoclosmatium globosum TaxID=329046 RepID=A0A1Y2B0M9_9FUNG|nr:hypothetical protein BCR33DRAFT_745781 [Rhizoclosmatium globosum]|eukprot:ORY28110.1 hypothetical protein BCR33DRAFT_745781 [Rhizoclosmatium globosum]